jgi:hypothetical protein
MKLKKISVFIFLFAVYTQLYSQMWVPATPFPGALGNISNAGVDETRINCLYEYNGELIVGGNFNNIGGLVANGIAKWNGISWSTLGQGNYLSHKVTDICEFDNKLFIASGALKCWDGSQWSDMNLFDVSTGLYTNVSAKELHVLNGELYILTYSSDFLKYNGTTFIELSPPNGYLYCLDDFNGELYIGTDSGVYKYSNQSWVNISGVFNNNPIVVDLENFNGELYAIGLISSIGGLTVKNLAKFNGFNWESVTLPNGYWPMVEFGGEVSDVAQNSLKVINNNLYVAAYFANMQANNFDPNPLYKLNGSGWSDVANNCTSNLNQGFGNTCIIYQGELYVGGSFTTIVNAPWFDDNDNCFIKLNPNAMSLANEKHKQYPSLYPNPTSSEITITSDKFTNEPYTLFDQMGRTVGSGKLSGTNTTISLSTLSKGIYILKVEGAYESAIVVKE